ARPPVGRLVYLGGASPASCQCRGRSPARQLHPRATPGLVYWVSTVDDDRGPEMRGVVRSPSSWKVGWDGPAHFPGRYSSTDYGLLDADGEDQRGSRFGGVRNHEGERVADLV